MSLLAQLAIALAIFVAGAAGGVKFHAGLIAQRDLAAANAAKSDGIQQRKFNDKAAGRHAATVDRISNQLGDAREKIAKLSARECLDADAVGVLNAIGSKPGGAAAAQPAGEGRAFATAKDVGEDLALCRAWYAKVGDRLNGILDIEDRRYPPDRTPVP